MTRGILSAWALVVSLVIAVSCAVDAPSPLPLTERTPTTVAPEHADKPPMPAALRAAYIASVQKQAAEAYRIAPAASGLRAENALQRFIAEFAVAGALITPAASREGEGFEIAATQWGCEGSLVPVSPAEPEAEGNRVTYRREGLEEWFVNGPLGLEQGFRVSAPPACRGAGGQGLVIALGGGSALRAEAREQGGAVALRDGVGREALRGTDLYVVDAGGRQLPAAFEVGGEGLLIRVDDRGAVYPIDVDPVWNEQQKLTASDGVAGERFGVSVALSGDTALVGANGHMLGQGAAYVFVRTGSTWIQQQKLTASDGAASDNFGYSVALSGDTAIVGALGKMSNQGAAYVFVRTGSTWIQQQQLTASDGASQDNFGYSVALSGDTAIVGAFAKMSNQGAAYVFVHSGSTWIQQQKLAASDGAASDGFGYSVALSGDTAIVGANGKMSYQGAAYVFVRSGSTWIQQQKLAASDGAGNDDFGVSVALSGDTAIVGALGKVSNQGAAYVFVHSGSTWTERQQLTASDGAVYDQFGYAVVLSGDTAIVGTYGKMSNQGVAYVFVRNGSTWTERQQLTASDGESNDTSGHSVALNGGTTVVGAPNADVAYAFIVLSLQGEPCTTTAQCVSGACVDDVCCDTPCGGDTFDDCQACSKARGASADGTCTLLTGTLCDDHNACSQNDICQMGTCTGIQKACNAPDRCHDPGTCDPLTGTCSYGEPTSSSLPPADPTLTVPANLQRCTTNDDCKGDPGGHTTCSREGVCCNQRCEGKCMSCRLPASPGVCTAEHYVDLNADCGAEGYCLQTCDKGECVAANGQTQCAAPECTEQSHVRARAQCREYGEDACPLSDRQVFACGMYACDQLRGGCLKQCASVNDCAPQYVCNHNHECVPPPGQRIGSEPTCAFAPAPSAPAGVPGALAALALAALLRRRASRRRSRSPRLLTLPAALLAALLLDSGPARAQEPPATLAQPTAPAPVPAEPPKSEEHELARSRYQRGNALYTQESWAPALAEFLESRKLDPSWPATYGAAHCLKRLARFDEALTLYAALLREFADELPPDIKQDTLKSIDEVQKLVGTLALEGAEPGAAIAVDHQARGDYPLLAPLRLPSGSHVVRVYKEGFEPFEASVDLVSGKTFTLKAHLARLTQAGRLQVLERTGKALDILLDGNLIGRTPWEGPIAAGDHTVELRGQASLGALPARISVRPNARARLALTAEILDASLEVTPTPGDASIAIDGIFVGRGRWAGRLRPGLHGIRLLEDGYYPEQRKVQLERGKDAALIVKLRRDPLSPAWRKPGRFGIELDGAAALSPSLAGEVSRACSDCSSRLAFGGHLVIHGTYELWNGFGFGVSVGYLRLDQQSTGRPMKLVPVRLSPLSGAVDDTLKLRGFRFGAWASYHRGSDRFSLRLRLGAGVLPGTVSDTRQGSFPVDKGQQQACSSPAQPLFRESDPSCFSIGTAITAPLTIWFYLAPEVRLAARVARHLEITAGLEALILVTPRAPTWDDKLGLFGGKGGLASFGAERLAGPVVGVFLPGVGARYEF